MQQTMRWFGPQDTNSLEDLKQAGITGIVTATSLSVSGNVSGGVVGFSLPPVEYSALTIPVGTAIIP